MTAILAFDLETMPDVDAGRRLFGLNGTDAQVAHQMEARQLEKTDGRSDFLPPPFHRIVALGIAGITLGPAPKVKAEGFIGEERALVSRFLAAIERRPQLVSYNGNSFDLPTIRWRALINGVPTATLDGPPNQKPWESYLNRYSEMHVDLADALSGYGASPRIQLDEAARLVGLAGKTVAHGSEVFSLVQSGAWDKITEYVKDDARQTLLLFLRWELGRGRIPLQVYEAALASLNAPAEELVLS